MRPVTFTVHAVVTHTDLEFDVKDIDFGHCTIHESVKMTVNLTNKSILPQQYGFVGVPQVMGQAVTNDWVIRTDPHSFL